MTVHGVLHLLGYDHIDDNDAEQYGSTGNSNYAGLGFPPPYTESTHLDLKGLDSNYNNKSLIEKPMKEESNNSSEPSLLKKIGRAFSSEPDQQ